MPLNNLGYRNWLGRFSSHTGRWMIITKSGVAIAPQEPMDSADAVCFIRTGVVHWNCIRRV